MPAGQQDPALAPDYLLSLQVATFQSQHQPVAKGMEFWIGEKFVTPGPCEWHSDDLRYPARPRVHYDDFIGKKHCFVDAMRYKERCRLPRRPNALQLDIHLAAQDLVECAERLIE